MEQLYAAYLKHTIAFVISSAEYILAIISLPDSKHSLLKKCEKIVNIELQIAVQDDYILALALNGC